MNITDDKMTPAMQLLERMFDAELAFMRSASSDVATLGAVFHPDGVIHEPASLPYAGDWSGLDDLGRLFRRMSGIRSKVSVNGMKASRSDDMVFMNCQLRLICRASGAAMEQPFA